jgi:Skp family chaperone for outer membrane proteins
VLPVLLLGLASGAAAADKIAVVDYQKIFDAYEGTRDAQTTLDRELKEWDVQARTMRQEVDALSEELESQRLMLSEERLREKQDELRRKREEYQRFAEEIWGVSGQAAARNAELTQPIAERILDIIAKAGEEADVDLILDAGTGGVVWARDEVNLTDRIIEDLRISIQGPAGPEGDE